MEEVGKITGRPHHLFDYYGEEDAEYIIVAMGSVVQTAKETIDYLMSRKEKVGMIVVHLFRPFSAKHLLGALPKTVKKIAVLDRDKEIGAVGDPLYEDVCVALAQSKWNIPIIGGRYGLSSKDTTPDQIATVYENLKRDESKDRFTIGIVDDVTNTSLTAIEIPDTSPQGQYSAIFWGMGSDGTVGANKNSIKIIGEATNLNCQAYFVYDSKKSGGLTQSHLRFGAKPIRSAYLVRKADFIACHNPSYVSKYDMVKSMKQGGTFLLNCPWNADELEHYIPAQMKKDLADKKARLVVIDAIKLARMAGLGNRTNTILQAAFFKLTGVIELNTAVQEMKAANYKSYF